MESKKFFIVLEEMMESKEKHSVIFYSLGTFLPERTSKPIPEWDTKLAVGLSKGIVERYNVKPHSFRFHTQLVADPIKDTHGNEFELQPKEVCISGLHYLGGVLRTYNEVVNEVVEKNSDEGRILKDNMRSNRMWIVIENTNFWRFTGEFSEKDCIVDENGLIVRRGNDPDLVAYRKQMNLEKDKEL